ncbi:hypothetical protein FQN50_004389 [Emmonsiellopsis sp. PD_5]|nr:hypothetical protein FQN50_004389 [Emmonsiellopsis sp. PD_5]
MSTFDEFLQQMLEYIQGASVSESTITSSGICSGSFFLPFRWSPERPHSYCPESAETSGSLSLFIRISNVDDEVMWDVDLYVERMQATLGSPITVAAEPGIPAILLAAMTATIGVYRSLEDLLDRRAEDRWITALFNLRDQIPMEVFRGRMQGTRFVADVIQLTLEEYMPGYQSW